MLDAIIVYTFYILYILLNFKLCENWWEETHNDYHDYFDPTYADKNILQTIKRRYYFS